MFIVLFIISHPFFSSYFCLLLFVPVRPLSSPTSSPPDSYSSFSHLLCLESADPSMDAVSTECDRLLFASFSDVWSSETRERGSTHGCTLDDVWSSSQYVLFRCVIAWGPRAKKHSHVQTIFVIRSSSRNPLISHDGRWQDIPRASFRKMK